MKQEGFQRLLMRECEKAGGILPWSKKHGIPFSTVRWTIKGRLPTEPICRVLGYKYEARFVKIKDEAAA
jgi:hypothetical protein